MIDKAVEQAIRKILVTQGLEGLGRYYSLYRGRVVANEDPEKRGRLRIFVPSLMDAGSITDWAVSRSNFASSGLFVIPQIDDVVWVSFECGDPSYPVWETGWNGEQDVPNELMTNGTKPTNYFFKTPKGNTLEFDDQLNTVRLKNKDGIKVELDANQLFIGKNSAGSEPAVLGDKNEQVLEDLKNRLADLVQILTQSATTDSAVASALALAGYISTIPQLTQLLINIQTISSKIPLTKSNIVNLD